MIEIRTATPHDSEKLNELIAFSARKLSQDYYSEPEIEGAIRYIFGVDSELLQDKTYFVVEKDGEIAGCGGWRKRKTLFGGNQFSGRGQAIYLDPSKEAAKIRAFFIHPQFARQGLGSQLLKYCEQQAYLQGFTKLEMMATLPGVKLYSALAYEVIAEERVLLPNGLSIRFVRMLKNVNQAQPSVRVELHPDQ
ncbi:GNAT family N-acetyltransferase [Legionella sp. km772]|uniref:GNAT family N-acetyltransferase n=1 Tax=Legionella sp. km772 TaxID=2498111 RepID=UPI000F8E0584|nr:GNAT family N-acetyltransferase [Legionella sp. km772]RUR04964.1 GNAT family N-acetyltransferase [Legionella sp. km772]